MGNGSTIPCHLGFRYELWGDADTRDKPVSGFRSNRGGGTHRQIRESILLTGSGSPLKGANLSGVSAEKSLYARNSGCPYRKPTLVGEVNIHRRAGETSSRNSAS